MLVKFIDRFFYNILHEPRTVPSVEEFDAFVCLPEKPH